MTATSVHRSHWPLVAFPLAKLVVHLTTLPGYGWFRDELYYVVCSERLDFGYVDHPPLSLLLLRVWRTVFGDALEAMRVLPALVGAATVLAVGLLARRLGAGPLGQAVAMIGVLGAPVFLAFHHVYSMNAYSGLFWALAAILLIDALERPRPSRWLWLGLLLGLGLQNKLSVLWLGAGFAVGLVGTSHRRHLATAGPWLTGGVALAVLSPHLVWQVANGWPTAEFVRRATGVKMAPIAPLDLLWAQVEMLGPAAVVVWLGGLGWLLFSDRGRPHRVLGLAWLTVGLLLLAMGSSRPDYLAPAAVWLFAAGGAAWDGWLRRVSPTARWAVPILLLLGQLPFAPFALPALPVESYLVWADHLGVEPSTSERKELAELPQFYADMHGWEAFVDAVGIAADSLGPGERRRAVVFTGNYGEASAVEVLGRGRELPPAVSGHNNYWLWGPGDASGEVVLVVGGEREELEARFGSVERGAIVDCGRCMPYENGQTVWVARGLVEPLERIWPELRHFD